MEIEKAEVAIACMPVDEEQVRIVIKPTGPCSTYVHIEILDNMKDAEVRAKEMAEQYELPYEGIWADNPFTRKIECYFCKNRINVGMHFLFTKDFKVICEYCIQDVLEKHKIHKDEK